MSLYYPFANRETFASRLAKGRKMNALAISGRPKAVRCIALLGVYFGKAL